MLKISDSLKCIAWKGRALVVGFAGGQIEKVSCRQQSYGSTYNDTCLSFLST